MLRPPFVAEGLPRENHVPGADRRSVGKLRGGIEVKGNVAALRVSLDPPCDQPVERKRLVIAARHQAFDDVAADRRRGDALYDEGVGGVEGAKEPLHQTATLSGISVGRREAAEALGPWGRAMHGNGMASFASERPARPAPPAADGDPEQDHAADSIGTRSARTSKKMQVHGTMRLAVSANIPPNWSRGAG